MSSQNALFLLDELINIIESGTRKGAAQSAASLAFKFKSVDKHVDRSVLKKLQKYRVLNPDDMMNRDIIPNMKSILDKYLSIIDKNKQKNGNKYKLIVLLRHGEGYHNWAKWELYGPEEWTKNQSTGLKWKDPLLTKTGIQQVKKLFPRLKCLESHVELIISSPLHRALQTATYACLPFVEKDKGNDVFHSYKCPVYVLEYTRERINYHSCDSRNNFDVIKNEWKNYDFKYEGFVTNDDYEWDNKTYKHEPREKLWARCAKMLDFIWNRNENIVIYSGHCDFMMALMEVILDMPFHKPKNGSFYPVILASA